MTSDELLQKGIAAYHAGRDADARELLMQAAELDPDNEGAWLWLSSVVSTDEERLACLEQVLALNPGNAAAQVGLDLLRARGLAPAPAPPLPPSRAEPEPPVGPPTLSSEPAEPEPPPPAEAEAPASGAGSLPPQGKAAKDRDDISPKAFCLALAGLGAVFVCVLGLLLYLLLGPGIQLPGAQPTDPPYVITDVLYEQLAAYSDEDVDRYMATMHSETKDLEQIRTTLAGLLAKYDLRTRLYDVEVVKTTNREAHVKFTLETRKVRGPAFRDNRVRGVFILRKEDGVWKMYDQKVDKVEYLE